MAHLISSAMVDPARLHLPGCALTATRDVHISTRSLLPQSNLFLNALSALFPLRLLSLSLSHTHIYTHTLSLSHTYTRTHRQMSSKSSVSSQPSTYLLAMILSKIVNCLRPLPPSLHRDHSSHDPTSIARHNLRPSKYSQTTY
jgi:hypothetical protein